MKVESLAALKSPRTKFAVVIGALAVAAIAALAAKGARREHEPSQAKAPGGRPESFVELVGASGEKLRLRHDDSARVLGVRVAEVEGATGPQALRLAGTLALDPSRLVHVHARFGGEAVSIGTTKDASGETRPLRFGDAVKRGQLLAIVWSKEIGEKKSELVDASSRLEACRAISDRLRKLPAGLVSEHAREEARRDVELAVIAVAKAERTLRSWRLTDEEIASIYAELRSIRESNHGVNSEVERRWAEIEIRAAIDGVIVEKSFNVGDMVESNEDLFKIADLSRLQVLANVYEEDLRALRNLKPKDRRWSIDLRTDRVNNRIPGTFDLIGSVIDPAQRTGVVMGWLDNQDGKLAVGQFITATIELPHEPNVVAIPASAVLTEGDSALIFVEVDRDRREFARREVAIVHRGVDTLLVNSTPTADGKRGLQVGERVVVAGVSVLGDELAVLRTIASRRD